MPAGKAPLPDHPLQRLLRLLGEGSARRKVVGLVGLPGAGKSTFAAALVESVNRQLGCDAAMALGMDGFHLTRAQLAAAADPAAALARRGAPWTFDPAALAERMRLLRGAPPGESGVQPAIGWPSFSHGRGDPVADAITVGPTVRLVVVEGLYLLHQDHGWQLQGLMDETWYLDVDVEAALERLTRRHMASSGAGLAQAQARIASNDRLNCAYVLATRARADWLVEARYAGMAQRDPD